MAKIYGLFGSMTGKLADTVMSVRNGEQIARKYQPVVFNPSTPAQVANRAKLKLMSQMSAVMAPYIAMRREGSVSSRNMFVKENFKHATFNTDTAEADLLAISLTKSVVGLSDISGTRGDRSVSVGLNYSTFGIDRVVYVAFFRQPDGELRAAGSTVQSTPGEANTFQATVEVYSSENLPIIVYAYGVRDNTEAARVAFANMVVDAQNVANVVTSRSLTEADITLTETQSLYIAPTTQANLTPSVESDNTRKTKK